MSDKQHKPWYKKVSVWVVAVIAVLVIAGVAGGGTSKTKDSTKPGSAPSSSDSQKTKTQDSAKPKWDAAAIYDQIQAGMTKAQVEQVTGKAADNCSQSAIQGAGTYEYCNYSGGLGDKGVISVTYQNDVVSTKSKIDF